MSFGSDRSQVSEQLPTVCLIDADWFRIALSRTLYRKTRGSGSDAQKNSGGGIAPAAN
jgi:hypothetical protein